MLSKINVLQERFNRKWLFVLKCSCSTFILGLKIKAVSRSHNKVRIVELTVLLL